jgi:hypothetical protein
MEVVFAQTLFGQLPTDSSTWFWILIPGISAIEKLRFLAQLSIRKKVPLVLG